MANLLTFVRPFRPDRIGSILLVQSGPVDLALRVGERLQAMLPNGEITVVVREDHRDAVAGRGFGEVIVVRWEDRLDVIRTLRRRRFDTVAVLMSHGGSDYLRLLPYLLRTRSVLAFNDNLDFFPVHVTRVATLALHVSGRHTLGGLLRWAAGRGTLACGALVVLVASTLRLQIRARWRRGRTLSPSGA